MSPPLPLLTTAPTLGEGLGSRGTAALLLGGAAVAFYVAARALDDASSDRQRGLVYAAIVPTATVSLLAALAGVSEVALALTLGVAVALVTIVLGMALLTRPTQASEPAEAGGTATLLPAGVAIVVAGQGGQLGVVEVALLLAVAGGLAWATLPAWRPGRVRPARVAQGLFAILVAGAAGWLAMLGAAALGAGVGRDLSGIDATMLAGPMVVLPAIGLAIPLAAAGRHAATTASLCSAATLAAGVLLPLAAALAVAQSGGEAIPVAPRLFRIDASLLAVVGLLVLPVAAGRWRPGAVEGIGLLVLYVVYLIVNVAAAR